MVAMAAEDDGDVEVPPTLQALLAARLDQLDAGERRVLERGSVEGEVFHRGAVQALTPEETQVTPASRGARAPAADPLPTGRSSPATTASASATS
jgi:predicted ATPase